MITQDVLDIRIRKKIEGEHFRDMYELLRRATNYEALLREETRATTINHLDVFPLEVDMIEFGKGEMVICEPLVKKIPKQSQRNELEKVENIRSIYKKEMPSLISSIRMEK